MPRCHFLKIMYWSSHCSTIELAYMHECSRCYGGKFCHTSVASRALMHKIMLIPVVVYLLSARGNSCYTLYPWYMKLSGAMYSWPHTMALIMQSYNKDSLNLNGMAQYLEKVTNHFEIEDGCLIPLLCHKIILVHLSCTLRDTISSHKICIYWVLFFCKTLLGNILLVC